MKTVHNRGDTINQGRQKRGKVFGRPERSSIVNEHWLYDIVRSPASIKLLLHIDSDHSMR
jgi:hypothetical protein